MRGKWEKGPLLPVSGRLMAGGVWNGRLYLCGGESPGEYPAGRLWIFDPISTRWEEGARMPVAVSGHACAAAGGELCCMGGRNAADRVLDMVQLYDFGAGSWRLGAPLPEPRWQHAAAEMGGSVFCAGGHRGYGQTLKSLLEYRPSSGRWMWAGEMLTDRRGFGMAGWEGRLYFAGGSTVERPLPMSHAERRCPGAWGAANGSGELPPLPNPRAMCGFAQLRGKLLCVGGITAKGRSRTDVLDIASGVWEPGAELPEALAGCCVLSDGERVYAVGGFGEGKAFSDSIWIYSADFD